jgi:hypothetical protein
LSITSEKDGKCIGVFPFFLLMLAYNIPEEPEKERKTP